MYRTLQEMNQRPRPFEHHSAAELWTDEHRSSRMLAYHLDGSVDISSRKREFINRSAAWMIQHFSLDSRKRVADFGCGPGLYTTQLAASGAAVTGVDFSERSIRHAREQARRLGLSIDYHQADYLEFSSAERFDLVIMIMCDFCALSPAKRERMLRKFHDHLRPGGAALLDVYSLAAYAERREQATYEPDLMDGFWSAEPYFGFVNTFKYDADKVVLDRYTIVEESHTQVVYNWLQYFDGQTLKAEVEASGLVVEELLGDVAGGPFDAGSPEFALIARRS